MLRALYFSTAAAGITPADVDAIIAHAKSANSERGITGALGYNGRNFCQLLEGEEATIRSLLAAIEKDPRHSGFKLLDEKQVQNRKFENWSMKEIDALDFSQIIGAMND
ncbi:BLUF domain-containing protein [Yoonia sp. 208BN28-4]|uniref:BLUF domain-containing protein n=1 Tax=Yoonia sp. 208BN28-4 TaxID=3126505 RepID=UPI0030AEBA25